MKLRFSILLLLLTTANALAQDQQITEQIRRRYETAQQFESQSAWQAAEAEWRGVLQLAPEDGRALVNLGVTLNRQNKPDEALAAWTRAIKFNSQLAGAHFNIGLYYVRTNRFAEAVLPLRQTIKLEPDNDAARRALALSLIGAERFQEATRELATALARSPQDVALLELAAESLMRQKRFAEAIKVLDRRIKINPATSRNFAQLGDAFDGATRTTEAAEAYRQAVALAPEDALTRYGYGYLLWKLYRYPEAETELKEVLRRNPNDARAAWTLGDLYLTRGTDDSIKLALPLLELAVRAYPDEFDTRFSLGQVLLKTGDTTRAILELRRATEIRDTIADGHFQLGRALQQAGKRDEAKQSFDRARALQNEKREREGARFGKP